MTRSRSSRARHRGRRSRPAEDVRPEGDGQGQASEGSEPVDSQGGGRPGASEQRTEQRTPRKRQPASPQRDPSRDGSRAAGPGRPERQRVAGGPHQGPGGSVRNVRRRQPRRQPVVEMSGEIIKRRAAVTAIPRQIIKRSLEELEGPEGPVLGCPMLSRTRLSLPVTGGHPAPRCSLGWGLHSEEEAMYCMMTPDLTLCWKANPERLDILREKLEERDTAAD